ncbi:hypothetical protein K491DRAFT_691455 [Lophiostoma macrostomum CBS 122681]|uniref:Uncharacterized protein n=1 Tax=Lophiostoma macrostomum CBS 122681 TaxID=1314788 RepID=A0A6A6TCM8_9PLEO|nr:hypothetical protein K491DRAFT_691455 [Lophiostoma macrostomum CBS 122681]
MTREERVRISPSRSAPASGALQWPQPSSQLSALANRLSNLDDRRRAAGLTNTGHVCLRVHLAQCKLSIDTLASAPSTDLTSRETS